MRLLSRLISLRVPRPLVVVVAAGFPAAAVWAALSSSHATGVRYQPAPPDVAAKESPFVVALADGAAGTCQVGALVTDVADGGAARAGVALRLERVTAEGTAEVWTAMSDRKGAHRFLDLPAGDYTLTALPERGDGRAPAASPPWRCSDNARAFFTLPLIASDHVFSGRVTSQNGKAAPGAELAIAQDSDARTSLGGTARIPVAADGSFSIRMPAGRYLVMAQAPNHAQTVRKMTFANDAPASVATIALTPAPHVTGRVVDDNGDPVADAMVALGGILDPKQHGVRVQTDVNGAFSLPVMDGQDVVLTARSPHGLVARSALGVVHGALGFPDVRLTAIRGRAVQGDVTQADGSAWAFGEVRYRVRELGLTGVEKVDADGHFVVEGMPQDADVEVWAEGNATGAWGAQVASPGADKLALVYVPPAY